jgi:hypothetical protein
MTEGKPEKEPEGIMDVQAADAEQLRKPRARDEGDNEPRRRRRGEGDSAIPCPKCGSRWLRSGPWPWYLGTIGAFLCRAVTCQDCGHEFDAKKPHADWPKRRVRLALILNGIGLFGIIAVIGGLILLIALTMGK